MELLSAFVPSMTILLVWVQGRRSLQEFKDQLESMYNLGVRHGRQAAELDLGMDLLRRNWDKVRAG